MNCFKSSARNIFTFIICSLLGGCLSACSPKLKSKITTVGGGGGGGEKPTTSKATISPSAQSMTVGLAVGSWMDIQSKFNFIKSREFLESKEENCAKPRSFKYSHTELKSVLEFELYINCRSQKSSGLPFYKIMGKEIYTLELHQNQSWKDFNQTGNFSSLTINIVKPTSSTSSDQYLIQSPTTQTGVHTIYVDHGVIKIEQNKDKTWSVTQNLKLAKNKERIQLKKSSTYFDRIQFWNLTTRTQMNESWSDIGSYFYRGQHILEIRNNNGELTREEEFMETPEFESPLKLSSCQIFRGSIPFRFTHKGSQQSEGNLFLLENSWKYSMGDKGKEKTYKIQTCLNRSLAPMAFGTFFVDLLKKFSE